MQLKIELTRGKKTIVSPEDFDFLSQWKWYCTDKGRAARAMYVGQNKSVTVYMHRVIADRMGFEGHFADHANRDQLDNRRSNLRPCSKTQNNCNRGKVIMPNTKSRFKGVCGRKKGRWAATIAINGKKTWIGTFDDEESAARAYDEAARNLHGEFAFLNFPEVREARSAAPPPSGTLVEALRIAKTKCERGRDCGYDQEERDSYQYVIDEIDRALSTTPDARELDSEEAGDTDRLEELASGSKFSASWSHINQEWTLNIQNLITSGKTLREAIDKQMVPGSGILAPQTPVEPQQPKSASAAATKGKEETGKET